MTATRRLAAILAADVVGYSRLIGVDEEGTLAALKSLRRDVTDRKIEEYHGRVVTTTGDGVLIEFANLGNTMPPFRRPEDGTRYTEGLRRAGLPE